MIIETSVQAEQCPGRWALELGMVGLDKFESFYQKLPCGKAAIPFILIQDLSPAYVFGVHCLASPTTF